MITLTRLLARQLRSVLRRALSATSREFGPPVVLEASPEGLAIRVWNDQAAIEYRQPGNFPAEQLAVPLVLLSDCEGTKDSPVTIEAAPKGRLLCQWQENQVPLITRYDAQKLPQTEFPKLPHETIAFEPSFLSALDDAMQTADEHGVRYALHCVQLHGGRGEIAGTDGRQLLVQSGFQFPWSDEVLIPRTTVFRCKELPRDAPIRLGRDGNWISFEIGPWTIQLAILKEGRYPSLESYFRPREEAVARLELSAGDATFLAENLKHLPCDPEDHNQEVTVDLNGAVVVRSRSPEETRDTQLELSNSRRLGQETLFHTDRRYLSRALAMGFREFFLYGPEVPLICADQRRRYAWAPLSPERAQPATGEPIQIHSPVEGESSTSHLVTRKLAMSKRKRSAQAEPGAPAPNESPNGHAPAAAPDSPSPCDGAANGKSPAEGLTESQAAANGQPDADETPNTGPIEQAIALRDSLRAVLDQTNTLVQALRRQKKQQKLMQATLESIRQLQSV